MGLGWISDVAGIVEKVGLSGFLTYADETPLVELDEDPYSTVMFPRSGIVLHVDGQLRVFAIQFCSAGAIEDNSLPYDGELPLNLEFGMLPDDILEGRPPPLRERKLQITLPFGVDLFVTANIGRSGMRSVHIGVVSYSVKSPDFIAASTDSHERLKRLISES